MSRSDIYIDYSARLPPFGYEQANCWVCQPDSGRRLQGTGSPEGSPVMPVLKTLHERSLALQSSARSRPTRSLSWAVSPNRFTAWNSEVAVICPDPWHQLNQQAFYDADPIYQDAFTLLMTFGATYSNWPTTIYSKTLSADYGQMIYDSGVCDVYKQAWVSAGSLVCASATLLSAHEEEYTASSGCVVWRLLTNVSHVPVSAGVADCVLRPPLSCSSLALPPSHLSGTRPGRRKSGRCCPSLHTRPTLGASSECTICQEAVVTLPVTTLLNAGGTAGQPFR